MRLLLSLVENKELVYRERNKDCIKAVLFNFGFIPVNTKDQNAEVAKKASTLLITLFLEVVI